MTSEQISQIYYDEWRFAQGLCNQPLDKATNDEVKEILLELKKYEPTS